TASTTCAEIMAEPWAHRRLADTLFHAYERCRQQSPRFFLDRPCSSTISSSPYEQRLPADRQHPEARWFRNDKATASHFEDGAVIRSPLRCGSIEIAGGVGHQRGVRICSIGAVEAHQRGQRLMVDSRELKDCAIIVHAAVGG